MPASRSFAANVFDASPQVTFSFSLPPWEDVGAGAAEAGPEEAGPNEPQPGELQIGELQPAETAPEAEVG